MCHGVDAMGTLPCLKHVSNDSACVSSYPAWLFLRDEMIWHLRSWGSQIELVEAEFETGENTLFLILSIDSEDPFWISKLTL